MQDEKNQLLITNIWLKLVSYGNKLLNVITNSLEGSVSKATPEGLGRSGVPLNS